MMKFFIYFVVYIYLKIQLTKCYVNFPEQFDDYLNIKKISIIQQERTEKLYKRDIKDVNYQFNTKNIGEFKQSRIYKHSNTFCLFNQTFLLLENDLYEIITDDGSTNFRFHSKLSEDSSHISHIENIEYNDYGYVITQIQNKTAKIMQFLNSSNTFTIIQEIGNINITNTKFFINAEALYLIISNNRGENLAPTNIYKWTGTYFDQIIETFTKGTIQITSFPSGKAEIIILQNKFNDRVHVHIYEFYSDSLNKIQIIKSQGSQHCIIPYVLDNVRFVLICISENNCTIYRWSGSELVDWAIFEVHSEINRALLMYNNGTPIILVTQNDKLLAYNPTPNNIKLMAIIHYETNFTKVLNFHHVYQHTNKIFIVGTMNNYTQIKAVSLQIRSSVIETNPREKDVLLKCLTTLREDLFKRQSERNKETIDNIRHSSFILENSKHLVSASSKNIRESNNIDIEDMENDYIVLKTNLENIRPIIDTYSVTNTDLVANGKLLVKGTLKGGKLITYNLDMKIINKKKWVPEQWLSYTKAQTIAGEARANDLNVIHLKTTSEIKIFDNILLNNAEQSFSGTLSTNNLVTNKLYADYINNISMKDAYTKTNTISGNTTFKNLKVGSIRVKKINGEDASNILKHFADPVSRGISFAKHVHVDNLEIEEIDSIHWDELKNSVFRLGITDTITGNIIMPELKTNHLILNSLSGVNVGDLMTATTNQTVESSIEFEHIFTKNVSSTIVNGISLSEASVTINDTFVKGPITIEKMRVLGDLEINASESLFLQDNKHIFGTNESDLSQIYNGKVKIIGNILIENLFIPESAQVFLSEKELEHNIVRKYWTKTTNQVIPIHVEAQNGLTTPHLLTKSINRNEIKNFMLNNTNEMSSTLLSFENVTVFGSVVLDDFKSHSPSLKKINEESVKQNGSYAIGGKKIFTGTLKVEHLIADEINGIEGHHVVSTDGPFVIKGRKFFKNLIMRGNMEADKQSCDALNNIDLRKMQKEALYVNSPQTIVNLHFSNVTVQHLNVSNLNDEDINEHISKVNAIIDSKEITIVIDGNVVIQNIFNVSNINDRDVDAVYGKGLKISTNSTVLGNIKFLRDINIDNLHANYINNIHFPTLTRRMLYKVWNQTIPAHYTFTSINADNLLTPKINNATVVPLVDVKNYLPQKIIASNGIRFSYSKLTSLQADTMLPCDIENAMALMSNPPTQVWSHLHITGNVSFLDEESLLANIFQKAVTSKGSNVIYAPVKFLSDFSVKNVVTHKHINDIDILSIVTDALMKQSATQQIVRGPNMFRRISVYSATVMNNSDVPIINNIEIPDINKRIIHKDFLHDAIIRGRKTFYGGLQADKFYSSSVSNMDPAKIVSLKNLKIIPEAVFDNITMTKDLVMNNVNNVNFTNMLENRLICYGVKPQIVDAMYSFDSLEVTGNINSSSINDIYMDEVIFDELVQEIKNSKKFAKRISIMGETRIDYMNGLFVSESYEKAMLKDENSSIEGNVKLIKPCHVDGRITAEFINGYSIADANYSLSTNATNSDREYIQKLVTNIEDVAKINFNLSDRMPKELMYIEKSNELQISILNTNNARTIKNKEYVLIHITGEEQGGYCGLPVDCKCPIQYTVQISPEHSINSFVSKGSQRVFSYDDDSMTIHFVTDSISTSTKCRTSKTKVLNEVSSMAWNTIEPHNNTSSFYTYPTYFSGYISGVEFFTLRGITYAIVGRYYDAVTDSYDLSCQILRFSEDKMSAKEIQTIPAKGIWSLNLFHTAQAVTLVIGLQNDQLEETLFYRFDEKTEKFYHLRTVQAYGCSSAAGVVLGADSLIVLIHKRAPLLIFKYDSDHDNYYFYQTLFEESPVIGVSVFYSGGFGISDPYLCVVSENGYYTIYSYKYVEGWRKESSGQMEGLTNLIPFEFNEEVYLFAPSTNVSMLLTVIKYGST